MFGKDTTIGEIYEKAKFKPGDIVTHKACYGDVVAKFVIVSPYVELYGTGAELFYFVRGVSSVTEGSMTIQLSWYSEGELEPYFEPIATVKKVREASDGLNDVISKMEKLAQEKSNKKDQK